MKRGKEAKGVAIPTRGAKYCRGREHRRRRSAAWKHDLLRKCSPKVETEGELVHRRWGPRKRYVLF
jgi:hypothetical protein